MEVETVRLQTCPHEKTGRNNQNRRKTADCKDERLMRKALVFQHVEHESPGLLGKTLSQNCFEIHTVNFGAGDSVPANPEDFSLLVVMGGPMSVYESDKYPYLAAETGFVREFIERGSAVMGICLGAQIMAAALGAKVFPGNSKEIGWYDIELTGSAAADPVFSHFSRTEKVFQWHGDTFETPRGAANLAFSGNFPNQAFRYGNKAYALQFHLETDEAMVRDWLLKKENRREIEAAGLDTEPIKRGIGLYCRHMKKLADAAFGSFLKLV